MRIFSVLGLLVLSIGCQSGRAQLNSNDLEGGSGGEEGTDDGTGDGGDGSGEDGGDGSDDGGDGGDDGGDEPFAHSGEYSGELDFVAVSEWWDLELDDCESWMMVEEDGELSGESVCVYDSGWDSSEYIFVFEGEVEEDGELSGVAVLELDWGGEPSVLGLEGSASDGELEIDCEGVFETDWADFELYGGGVLEAD